MKISAAKPPVTAPAAPKTTASAPKAAAAPAAPQAAPPHYLAPEVRARRLEAGRVAEYTTGTLDPKVIAAGPPTYFRTYEQVKTALFDLQKQYPSLMRVEDIGDTSEKARGGADRDVLAVRLTNQKSTVASKPSVTYLGGEHAREIANPELLMRFLKNTLAGYGTDPEATALLDTREINIIPMMNADGHAVVEAGYAQKSGGRLMQRKNTSPPQGTDLNRNYDFKWGGPGASSSPSSDTYRGAGPASEPEVQAVQGFVNASKPGVFIDWHSYSRLNLYPWGYTRDKAPDHAGLDAMARKFSTFNHYTPEQSIDLYPTNGTSKDWVYGVHKTPAFTIETGDTFHQSDKEFEGSWAENAPIMSYVAKIADAPYQRVQGPDVLDVNVAARAPGVAKGAARISAQVSDGTSGKDAVQAAEWVIDPSIAPGKGTPLLATDGKFDSASELVTGEIPGIAPKTLVYVRAQDAKGNWGPATAQWMTGTSK